MRSLSSRLFLLWLWSLVASIGVGVLLVQLFQISTRAEVDRAEAVVARACEGIRDRYDFYTTGWHGVATAAGLAEFRQGLRAVVAIALAYQPGIEGGIWQDGTGSLAYAFPTYAGTGPKTDLPAAEKDRIRGVNQEAARQEQSVLSVAVAGRETIPLFACPLGGPLSGITGWTMTRVKATPGYDRLRLGLGLLFLLLVAESGWLLFLAASWVKKVRRVAASLSPIAAERLPELAATGDPDLDRVVGALNEAGRRLEAARRRSAELTARVAKGERFAALGRMAAGFAHEIRNPMAAMRLKAENALAAGDATRGREALSSVLVQVRRIDGLVGELLEMTRGRALVSRRVDLAAFLASVSADYRELAKSRGIGLESRSSVGEALFDPELVGRAIGNLILNAIQHTDQGGEVRISAAGFGDRLRFEVANRGAGIAEDVRETLFEPFVTGRAEGTGLGLAIVREIAELHGGAAHLVAAGGEGAETVFAVDLPWRRS